jgi:hypothetical protein
MAPNREEREKWQLWEDIDVGAWLLNDMKIKKNEICSGTYAFALCVSPKETILDL